MHAIQKIITATLSHPGIHLWISTGVLMLVSLGLSRLADYWVQRSAKSGDARTLRTTLRQLLTVFFLVGMGVIWAEQVRHFLLAAAALLAAMLIVSKELIMCLLGNLVKTYGKLCTIGEVVELEGVSGEVIDSGFLSTSLQLIEHSYSGKIVSFPNSIFLTRPVTHLSTTGDYRLVFVRIPVATSDAINELSDLLLAIVGKLVQPYQAEAEKHLGKAREALLMDFPSMAPRILLEPKSANEVVIAARFVCPANQRSTVEQKILQEFYHSTKQKPAEAVVSRILL